MFINLLRLWLQYRPSNVLHESQMFYHHEVAGVPRGYYAVVTVELKRLDSQPVDLEMEMAVPV